MLLQNVNLYVVFLIASVVLFIFAWAIIATVILFQRRRYVVEQEKLEIIKESEERYRRFFEEDLTGDFIMSPEGAILYCNPAFASIFGFESVEEVLKQNYASFFPEPEQFMAFLKLVKTQRQLEYHEIELKRRDGEPLYIIENIIGAFDEAGNLTEIRGYLFDNTDRKLLEKQLLHAQKMQSIGNLAGGIAHDFNNILSIIMGHASLLEQDTIDQPHIYESIKAIAHATERGAHLVDQILTFARKADVVFEAVNINKIIEELYKLLSGTFPKTITITLRLDPQLPNVRADQNQLHQAFLNICMNARDAMPRGGTLTITTRTISPEDVQTRFPKAKDNDYVWISISDTGTGIDPEIRKHLFEPFFTTKVRGRGTGLGLAVVYGIITSHYGFVDVESESGKGSTFHFFFPTSAVTHTLTPSTSAPTTTSGTETILIVEDEDMLVDLLKTIFNANGYRTLIARDGNEAVQIYKEHYQEIDLVFTDAGLPKLSGWEAFKKMEKINPSIKAVFASGFFEPNLKKLLTEHGVIDFISKPYSPQDVVIKIREILDRISSPAKA